MIWLGIVAYILIGAASAFRLLVAAERYTDFSLSDGFDFPGVYIFCGIIWPVGIPFASAYIAAKWYSNNHK